MGLAGWRSGGFYYWWSERFLGNFYLLSSKIYI